MKKEEKEKKEKEKIVYVDDGRTIVDMDVEGFPWHGDKKRKKDPDSPTFREKLAMAFGAYRAYFPSLAILLLTGVILFAVCAIWLQH